MEECGHHGHTCLAKQKPLPDEIAERVRKAFEGMMGTLHSKAKGARLEIGILREKGVQGFIETHAGALNQSMQEVDMSARMRQKLEESNYIFSGMKTFHELNEAFPLLVDENGRRKPFERFLNDVQRVDKTYNRNYLRAEYNFVSASAEMAGRWEQFEKDGDRYLLQYRTVGDERVRQEHALLNRVTLPLSSSFWDEHYAPNSWNCRCTVVQVRKGKYPETDLNEAYQRAEASSAKDPKGMFRFNAGKEKKAIPDYNPYTISKCKTCPVAKGKGKSKLAKVQENELCKACGTVRQNLANGKRERKAKRREELQMELTAMKQRLPQTPNGKRMVIKNQISGDVIIINGGFYTEVFSKNKNNIQKLEAAVNEIKHIKEWLPKATYLRTEDGIHHKFPFKVYEVIRGNLRIEFKAKITDGIIGYNMRVDKIKD